MHKLWEQQAFVAAEYCPDKPAMIRQLREMLAALRAQQQEISESIKYGEGLIAALEQANVQSTKQ